MEVAIQDDACFLYQRDFTRLALVKVLPATWIRANVFWGYAGGDDGVMDLRRWDDLVNWSFLNGIRVQLTLAGTPAFAAGRSQLVSWRNPNVEAYGCFCKRVATHFKGRVTRYSIWNEPNSATFLDPPDPKLYRKLYVAGYDAIKEVDPKAQVLMGETASKEGAVGESTSPIKFLRGVCAGRKIKSDGYAHHPYQMTTPPTHKIEGDECRIGNLKPLFEELKRLHGRGELTRPSGAKVPVYLTEFGYAATGRRAISESKRAKWIPQAFEQARKSGAKQMLYYHLIEVNAAWNTGLVPRDGKPREPYLALQRWVRAS